MDLIRPILPSIRNTPYGKRIQSKLAREDASFAFPGGGNGYGGGGGGGRGFPRGGGGFQRHLGRPNLQHVNALTEVYGSHAGPYMPPQYGYPAYDRGGPMTGINGHGAIGAPHPNGMVNQGVNGHGYPGLPPQMVADHTGMSYHAPGPDGQQWLHLRGSTGQPAASWMSSPMPGVVMDPSQNPSGEPHDQHAFTYTAAQMQGA